MKIRKSMMIGAMGLLTAMPAKAQKLSTRSMEVVSEVGVMGTIKKDASFYGGLNLGFPTKKNYADVFAGVSVAPDKKHLLSVWQWTIMIIQSI